MAKKKAAVLGVEERRSLLEPAHTDLSMRRQCALLSVPRSGVYYRPRENPAREAEDSALRDLIWEEFSAHPVYGYRRICAVLRRAGHQVTPKRIRSLMREMGLQAIYPKRRLSIAGTPRETDADLLPQRVEGSSPLLNNLDAHRQFTIILHGFNLHRMNTMI